MWRWVKRWIDWARNDLLPLARVRGGGYSIHVRYDAGGHSHTTLPVPWSADSVTVEVLLRLPPAARRKTDFALHFPHTLPILAETVRPETGDRHRVTFRLPVPNFTAVGEFLWKHRPIAPVTIPVLSAETFLGGLTIVNPTLAVKLDGQTVAARTFAGEGCKGLLASALLRSPHRLGPVADMGLTVEFRCEATGQSFRVPVPLTAEQRATNETMVAAACPKSPRRPSGWLVAWRLNDRVLAVGRIEAITARRFEESVRVVDARFAVAGKDGSVRFTRQPPVPGAFDRVGPCFLLSSAEAATAGVCRLSVFTVAPGHAHPTLLLDQDVLITDAPTPFIPGLLHADDLVRLGGFELRLNGRILGSISLSPVPPATLTAEGGFKPPPDFTWTLAAEDELQDRLGRLGNPNG